MRITEAKLNLLVRELSDKQFKDLQQKLYLNGDRGKGSEVLGNVVRTFRDFEIRTKAEVIEKAGCTDGTYRSYKARLSEAVLSVISESTSIGVNQWLLSMQKAWALCQIGEYKAAYDLADSVLQESLKHERGAIARLALELMSSTAQEAYPDEAIGRLNSVGNQMFEIARQFFGMTDLYALYLTLGSKSAQTILLRSHEERGEWGGWNHRLSHHQNIKETPLSHWAYFALSKCHLHELKGELEEAFQWYDRLWKRLTEGQDVINLGDKRFLATFQSYILLALKSHNVAKAKKANELFRVVVIEHHALEGQQLAIQECFAIRVVALENGAFRVKSDLSAFILKMQAAKPGSGYYHANWSPHIRYELYLLLFNTCFELKEFDFCMMLLRWGNDRGNRTDTASDFTEIIPLLSTIVMIERCRPNQIIDFGHAHDTVALFSKQVYDKFRRKRELFPVEVQIGMFLFKLSNANRKTLPKIKATTLEALSKLKTETFYYPNLMQYFNFEEWIANLE